MPRPRDCADHHAVTATRHPRRLGLDERQRRAEIQRAPAPTTLTQVKPWAAPAAHTAAVTLATMRPDRDHDLSLVAEKDVLHDHALQAQQPRPYCCSHERGDGLIEGARRAAPRVPAS